MTRAACWQLVAGASPKAFCRNVADREKCLFRKSTETYVSDVLLHDLLQGPQTLLEKDGWVPHCCSGHHHRRGCCGLSKVLDVQILLDMVMRSSTERQQGVERYPHSCPSIFKKRQLLGLPHINCVALAKSFSCAHFGRLKILTQTPLWGHEH